MTSDPQRHDLLADLTRHLAPLSHDALRILDEFALGLLQVEREQPIELESLARQIVRFDPREPADLAINAAIHCIGLGLLKQDRDRAELTADDLRAAAKARVDRERRTAAVQVGTVPGDDLSDRVVVDDPDAAAEFRAGQLTEISPVPAAIARTMTPTLDEDPMPYDSLELEWDVSDIHAGEGK